MSSAPTVLDFPAFPTRVTGGSTWDETLAAWWTAFADAQDSLNAYIAWAITDADSRVAEALSQLRSRWHIASDEAVNVYAYQQYVVTGGVFDLLGSMTLESGAQLYVEA